MVNRLLLRLTFLQSIKARQTSLYSARKFSTTACKLVAGEQDKAHVNIESETKASAETAAVESDKAPAASPASSAGSSMSDYGSPTIEDLKEWRKKFEAKDKEAARFKEAYQQQKAEFQILQKRTAEQILKEKNFALQKFAKDLVETVDNFDLALGSAPEQYLKDPQHKEVQEFYNGIKMVQNIFEKTLEKHGLVKTYPMGEQFDPNEHEAVFQVPQPEKNSGEIFHVARTGFKLHDRVLRAPKVGIAAAKEEK